MDLEDLLKSLFVGFLLFCLYAAIYESLKPRVPLLAQTVRL